MQMSSHHKKNSFHQLISSQSISESENRSIYEKINIFKYARNGPRQCLTIKLSRFLIILRNSNRNIIFEMGQRNRIHALKYPHQHRLNEKRVVCRKNIHFYAAAHLHLTWMFGTFSSSFAWFEWIYLSIWAADWAKVIIEKLKYLIVFFLLLLFFSHLKRLMPHSFYAFINFMFMDLECHLIIEIIIKCVKMMD